MNPVKRLAITLRVADRDGAPVREWQAKAEGLEDTPSIRALGYAPHLTLTLHNGRWVDNAISAIGQVPAPQGGLRLHFRRLRYFEGPSLVIWLQPEDSPALRQLQRDLFAVMGADGADPHYTPDAWMAHCSLAMAVPANRLDQVQRFCGQDFTPFEVLFDRMECVEFPPVTVPASREI